MRTVICYGGGTNSAAMIVGLHEHGEPPPDLILFADTGGEKPPTYSHLDDMDKWLVEHGWPTIVRVKLEKRNGWESLEEQCLRLKVLPPIAYGFKTCSQRYKIEPQDKFLNNWLSVGEVFNKIIGYDFDETSRWRSKAIIQGNARLRFPLVEWQWGRDECVAAIRRAGLTLPGKSACFFCPSSKKSEVVQLAKEYPDLFDRALHIEQTARKGRGEGGSVGFIKVKGLGRSFSWETLEGTDTWQELPCECFDGEPPDLLSIIDETKRTANGIDL